MGWSTIPKPGEKVKDRNGEMREIGPCVEDCEHNYCEALRANAERLCPHCQKPIGYDTKHYGWFDTIEHAVCLWKKVEAEQAATD